MLEKWLNLTAAFLQHLTVPAVSSSFSENQTSCLEDFIQVSFMMQYNNWDV